MEMKLSALTLINLYLQSQKFILALLLIAKIPSFSKSGLR